LCFGRVGDITKAHRILNGELEHEGLFGRTRVIHNSEKWIMEMWLV